EAEAWFSSAYRDNSQRLNNQPEAPARATRPRWRFGLVIEAILSLLSQRPHANIAKRHAAVVALKEERPAGHLLFLPPAPTRRVEQVHILMNPLAVVGHLDEAGIGGLLAALVETRSLEDDVQCLPFARRFGGVDLWRHALVDGVIRRLQLAARVDAAAVRASQ